MVAIRGAITVNEDTEQQIRAASVLLLSKILEENSLSQEEIICLMISTTSDIKSFYPAKAVREEGYNIPLYSSAEPEMEGALRLCIRFMLLADAGIHKNNVKHIYLEKAKMLRKDLSVVNIALDGPAGSGKSTIARLLSKKLNILYLDTGAMYRAAALKALNLGISVSDEVGVGSFIEQIDLGIQYIDGSQHTFLDGHDVSAEIRRPEMSMAASDISKLKCVRLKMVQMQREIAAKMSCVLDGRDIGSFVLPSADYKFYLTADSRVRAQRRYDELTEKGHQVDFNNLLKEIEQRDINDKTRDFAPLKKADDAMEIDTSNLTIDEVIETVLQHIK